MRVIVLARTLNEERNIARFCRCYARADAILVADGGSTDRTVDIARQFENVEVRQFRERTLWSLQNAFTEVYKDRFKRNPLDSSVETIKMTGLLERVSSELTRA